MSAIKIMGLTKNYKDLTAVDSLNLEVEDGTLFSLLGVNGAGKTTTIKMLSGLVKPNSGTAELNGHDIVKDLDGVKKIIAVSPQETAVAPNLSVRENLELMAGIHGMDFKSSRSKADEMIEKFDFKKIEKKKAKALSGGWQRRLSIAMALISEPKILFLDEPTLGLDVLARRELWDIIRSLKGKVTVILTTHYLEEAESLSDKIAVMKDGKLKAIGTADELKKLGGSDKFEDAFINLVSGKGEQVC